MKPGKPIYEWLMNILAVVLVSLFVFACIWLINGLGNFLDKRFEPQTPNGIINVTEL
jgi:hypothetical protein